MKKIINYNNEYNFFTDSSNAVVYTNLNKEVRIASSGVLCTQGDLFLNSVNNIYINQPDYFGEIAAINQAVNWCKLISEMQMNNQNVYNVFSDSKCSIEKILMYINLLLDSKKKYNANSNNIKHKKISHFDLLAFIIARIIVDNGLLIRLIYIPGHTKIDANVKSALQKAKKKIIDNNKGVINENISKYTVHYVLLRNIIIDGYTRENLIKNKEQIIYDLSHTNLKELQNFLGKDTPIIWPYSFQNRVDYFNNNNDSISQDLLNNNNNNFPFSAYIQKNIIENEYIEGDKLKCICQRMI